MSERGSERRVEARTINEGVKETFVKVMRGKGQPKDRFDKFTGRVRKVLTLAQEEAERLNHNYMGTEHLLLGLLDEGEGVAVQALGNLGGEIQRVRGAVEEIIGHGNHAGVDDVGLTPRAKKVIELSMDEAKRMGHRYIGTEHLLLGLIREGDGIAAKVLESFGLKVDRVRTEITGVLANLGRVAESIGPKNNVVTCRLDDHDIDAIDALVEAGIRSTRSDAAAWLIHAGIETHRPLFEKVHATVAEIRHLRATAQAMAEGVTANEEPIG